MQEWSESTPIRLNRVSQLTRSALVVVAFFLPYLTEFHGKFLLASVLLLAALKAKWPGEWRERAGLRFTSLGLGVSVLALGIFALLSRFMILELCEKQGIIYQPAHAWHWRISPLFQAFNEEIFFRALLLNALLSRFKSPWLITFLTAAFFSALHWVLYRYNNWGAVYLTPLTLLNLFLFGAACNVLFLRFRHIGYGLALHAGWNLTRFAGDFQVGGDSLHEGVVFNRIEGSVETLGLLAIVGLVALSLCRAMGQSISRASACS